MSKFSGLLSEHGIPKFLLTVAGSLAVAVGNHYGVPNETIGLGVSLIFGYLGVEGATDIMRARNPVAAILPAAIDLVETKSPAVAADVNNAVAVASEVLPVAQALVPNSSATEALAAKIATAITEYQSILPGPSMSQMIAEDKSALEGAK